MRVSTSVKGPRSRGTFAAIPQTAVEPVATPRKALLDTQQAAEYLGVSFDTLCGWRVKGVGPRFVKLMSGGSRAPIRYRVVDLDEFIEAGLRNSTSDTGAAVRAGRR
jgi:Helix-turn-helix domain